MNFNHSEPLSFDYNTSFLVTLSNGSYLLLLYQPYNPDPLPNTILVCIRSLYASIYHTVYPVRIFDFLSVKGNRPVFFSAIPSKLFLRITVPFAFHNSPVTTVGYSNHSWHCSSVHLQVQPHFFTKSNFFFQIDPSGLTAFLSLGICFFLCR